jgi:bifunctional ADP-heptose synthase (sugar kinase/adenylyltransferase)/phosphoglycolate phosphatase-like HAD superfamily hydrolase
MDKEMLNRILDRLPSVSVGVFGDFGLDAYWTLDPSISEVSLETGLPTRSVIKQSYSLGGAGNVVANLAEMGVGDIRVFGVIGADPFGAEMRRLLGRQRANLEGLLVESRSWATPVYIKPILGKEEQNRMDLGNANALPDETGMELLARLSAALDSLAVVIVNQQLLRSVHTPCVQEGLRALMAKNEEKLFVVDSRTLSDSYKDCVHKLNSFEAVKLCGMSRELGDVIGREDAGAAARTLRRRWGRPVFVTLGDRGCLVADGDEVQSVPGLHIVRRTDPVGAGDSMLAGIAAAMAVDCPPLEAAVFGNFVAGVTVQQLFTTGTASPAAIREIGSSPDYIYEPELADNPRQAAYLPGSQIEMVPPARARGTLSHAIFDHDGTISTLRQGWEEVMEPMMMRAILGDQYQSADETTYSRVRQRVGDFIDKTTGVQTLVQMQGLVDLVREMGIVPESEILDEFGYKEIYNEALLVMVRERMARLEKGELDASDFTIKRAPAVLEHLHRAGVRLYLASGTDHEDVVREAEALGYAHLFEGRIYGAVGDVTKEAKRMVLDQILNEVGSENVGTLAAFGDGPVEMRETRKRGGLAVGLASDEVRRFGLNLSKRSRLIRAGAAIIVPDWSQWDQLADVLGVPKGT